MIFSFPQGKKKFVAAKTRLEYSQPISTLHYNSVECIGIEKGFWIFYIVVIQQTWSHGLMQF